jgi:hypothetical protein
MMNAYTYIKFTCYIVNPKNPNIVKREEKKRRRKKRKRKRKRERERLNNYKA